MSMSPRLLRPKGTAFNPKQISALQMWLDASDSATLFDATSGGNTPASDGAVARWADKSANAYAFTQGTANNRPLRKVSNQNGKDGIEFDGSNDCLYALANVFDSNVTLFAVAKFASTTARRALIDLNTRIDSTIRHFVLEQNTFATAGSRYGMYASSGSYDSSFSTNANANIFCLRASAASGNTVATSVDYRLNGVSGTLNARTAVTTFSDYTTSSGVMVGAFNDAGSNLAPTLSMAGVIYEIVTYNVRLADSQVSFVEKYLSSKWGIEV